VTKRIEVSPAPAPLEEYTKQFDRVFGKSNQREAFRWYLEGLLLPSERNKTLTRLVNPEPLVGAQLPRAQKLQWFLSESNWYARIFPFSHPTFSFRKPPVSTKYR
jgi:SRSO17 transposase